MNDRAGSRSYKNSDDEALSLRAPPVNFEAETQLLGAILSNNRAFEAVAEFLRADHFADERHARIFDATARLINRGHLASPVTLKNYFEQDSTLSEIGGAPYLGRLAKSAVTIINAREHGNIVYSLWQRRQLIALGEDMVNAGYSHDLDLEPDRMVARLSGDLDAVVEISSTGSKGLVPLRDGHRVAMEEAETAYKSEDKISGLSTGLTDLDAKLGGLHDGNLIILAGRPQMGKTALAWGIAHAVAAAYREGRDDQDRPVILSGAKVAFFSLEMTLKELSQRDLAGETGISVDSQRRGNFQVGDFDRIMLSAQDAEGLPLFIDDEPGLSLARMRQRCRKLKRTQGLGLVVIDYLQLIAAALIRNAKPQNRVEELTQITNGLKALAKELGCPVIALSQLSRKVEERDDKRPYLSDLRESGSIEQDADVVVFVYRDQHYVELERPRRRADESDDKWSKREDLWAKLLEKVRGEAELIVAKNRQGKSNVIVKVAFNGYRTKFSNLEKTLDV